MLEGRLVGPWIKELEGCWKESVRSGPDRRFVVDLTGVTFVEPDGKMLLCEMYQGGAELVATGCCMKSIVEDVKKQLSKHQVL